MELTDYRAQIDAIDAELLQLFQKRMRICAEIADYKQSHQLPVYQPEREAQKIELLTAQVAPEMRASVQALYQTIFEQSRHFQEAQQQRLRCGLIGVHLAHSYSPQLHALLGDYRYDCIELAPEALASFLETAAFDGLNVTIPYKQAVLPYCTTLSDAAARIGSVNTLLRRSDGTLYGDNTDYDGFLWLLERNGSIQSGEKAVVLGNGGASKAVQCVLRDLGAEVVVLSRHGAQHFDALAQHRDAVLLVNATPVGMYPDNGQRPVDLSQLPHCRCVLDLIYNPARTQLLLEAEARGIPCEGGLPMLVRQAVCASERFTGRPIPPAVCAHLLAQLRGRMQNLVLIGMPGCGKTTVGRALAAALHRPFLDSDAALQAETGLPPSELILRRGEDAFRDAEQRVLTRLGMQSGAVIATGGGVVTRPENYPLLHQNSSIIWLQRPLHLLETDNRPLSLHGNLEALYAQRHAHYAKFSDFRVKNDASVSHCVASILSILQEEGELTS